MNLLKERDGSEMVPHAAHPLLLLHVRSAKAAAANELGARVKDAPVVYDDCLGGAAVRQGHARRKAHGSGTLPGASLNCTFIDGSSITRCSF